jgi:hypothetical protein
VRLRITRTVRGTVDGICLDRFTIGESYDVGTSVANYLMASGWAVPATEEPKSLPLTDKPVSRQPAAGRHD